MSEKKERLMATLSLFASFSTLICCALPAFLVALGMGAVVAGIVSNVPGLIWLSRNKVPVFIAAGILIVAAGIMRVRGKVRTCPIDPVKAKVCGTLKVFSAWTYRIAVVLYVISILVSFVLPGLL